MSKRWISIAGAMLFIVAVFCAGFLFFYNRIQRSQAEEIIAPEPSKAPDPSKSLIGKPFPQAQLVHLDGSKVDEQVIRKGRVVVVFVTIDCDACETDSKFLQTVLERRKDVAFYGIVPFGPRPDSSKAAAEKFPFDVFYDQTDSFVYSMGINRVPVNVYLDDGIIQEGWIGAVQTDAGKTTFVNWLDSLQ
jgi:peroxiredoxin